MSKKKKALLATAGGVVILGMLASGGNRGKELETTNIAQAKTTCKTVMINHGEKTIETDKLPKSSTVSVVTGVGGKSRVCHEGDKLVSTDVQEEPTDTVVLIGTSDIPADYDGKYSQEDVVKDYTANGELTSSHFGTYTPPPPAPAPTPATAQPQSVSIYYKNCTEARAAGAAPVYAGQPGYGAHLDRDGDGVGCEKR